MEIHGITLDDWETSKEGSSVNFNRQAVAEAVNIALQCCTPAKFGPLQSDQLDGVAGATRP
jgi:hypothetical protein